MVRQFDEFRPIPDAEIALEDCDENLHPELCVAVESLRVSAVHRLEAVGLLRHLRRPSVERLNAGERIEALHPRQATGQFEIEARDVVGKG